MPGSTDPSHLLETERRVEHAVRPGFRIAELQISLAASLDDLSWFQPAVDVWTTSAQPWDYTDPGIPKFPKNR